MAKSEFRINKVEYVNKTFRLPKNIVDELGKAANEAGVSMNEFMLQALEFCLQNLVIDEKKDNKDN